MTTENSVGAASDTKVNRPTIDWRQVHRNVRRLQMRIVKATQNCGEAASQEGRWKGLSGLSLKIHEPFSGEGVTVMPPPYPTLLIRRSSLIPERTPISSLLGSD